MYLKKITLRVYIDVCQCIYIFIEKLKKPMNQITITQDKAKEIERIFNSIDRNLSYALMILSPKRKHSGDNTVMQGHC